MKQGLATEGNWRSAAACRLTDPELFFPIAAFGKALAQVAEAKAICARCPVRRQCLAFALRTRQPHGIWGGMTEEERASISRRGPQLTVDLRGVTFMDCAGLTMLLATRRRAQLEGGGSASSRSRPRRAG